ncbi:MAG: hypothetical protein PHT07_01115 [Paludibacter sp.]|nr:hypothetical protein [Paludibacter sp.]
MKRIIFLFFVFTTVLLSGKEKYSKAEIRQKTDSILAEGNLLYRYEKAAWVSTDLAMSMKEVKDNFGGYLIYKSEDSIKAIILGKDHSTCIYEMTFFKDGTNPYKELLVNRKLSVLEEELQVIKVKIMNEALTPAYAVNWPEGYSLAMEMIPCETGYKLYMLIGTSKKDVIPMGNDYIFFADKKGAITSWRKFHSMVIPAMATYKGEKVVGVVHSHLMAEPFITATDICNFKLYGYDYYGLKDFKVVSSALSKLFTYDAIKNTIETIDLGK